jgi:TonB family protein
VGLALLASVSVQAETSAEKAAREAKNREVILKNYPKRALAAGEQGMVAFKVRIDKSGQATSCEVTHSSGHRLLDDGTCQFILSSAAFKPVKDANGHRIEQVSEGVINWTIPGQAGPPIAAVATKVTGANAPEKVLCKRRLKPGTVAVYERICGTKGEWDRMTDETQGTWDEMQGRKGHTGG